MKANNVPMFVRSAREPMSVSIATPPTATPVQIVVMYGVRNRRMNSRKILRQQTVARHRHENARLPELENE